MGAKRAPETVRLHVGHGDSLVNVEALVAKQLRTDFELDSPRGKWTPSRVNGAPSKCDVRRGRNAFTLPLVHRRKHAAETVQKVGPIDQMIDRAVQHGPRYSHRRGVGRERLENLLTPILSDDAMVLCERDDLSARPLHGARAQLEHRR